LLCFFFLQIMVVVTAGEERKRSCSGSPCFHRFSCVTRRQWRGAWSRRATTVLQLRKSTWHCSGGAEGVPCKFQIVLGLLL
jgi:hypothetical protein